MVPILGRRVARPGAAHRQDALPSSVQRLASKGARVNLPRSSGPADGAPGDDAVRLLARRPSRTGGVRERFHLRRSDRPAGEPDTSASSTPTAAPGMP